MARREFQTPEAVIAVSTHAYFEVYPPGTPSEVLRTSKPIFKAYVDRLGNGIRTVGTGDGLNVDLDDPKLEKAVRSWARRFAAKALSHQLGTSPDRLPL